MTSHSTWVVVVLFLLALGLSAVASIVLAEALERLGRRLNFSEGLQGLTSALGADAPEIAAAVAAMMHGSSDMGVGVVLGSNIFNLAALLGLSALIAGKLRVRRRGVILNGSVAVSVAVIALLLVRRTLSAWLSMLILGLVFVPYVLLLAFPRRVLDRWLPKLSKHPLHEAAQEEQKDSRPDKTPPKAGPTEMLSIVPSLVSIVLASFWMVDAATELGSRWGIPHVVLGMLILATLTGLPNVLAAIRLATHGRGSAVVSESLNSNTINVLAGMCLPGLLVGVSHPSSSAIFAAWWLLAMTVAVVAWAAWRRGIYGLAAAGIIAGYAAFVLFLIL